MGIFLSTCSATIAATYCIKEAAGIEASREMRKLQSSQSNAPTNHRLIFDRFPRVSSSCVHPSTRCVSSISSDDLESDLPEGFWCPLFMRHPPCKDKKQKPRPINHPKVEKSVQCKEVSDRNSYSRRRRGVVLVPRRCSGPSRRRWVMPAAGPAPRRSGPKPRSSWLTEPPNSAAETDAFFGSDS